MRPPTLRHQAAARLAAALPTGAFVNLGIGLPSLVARHIAPAQDITLHSENGLLHFGGPPAPDDIDTDLVDAGKSPVTLLPGSSFSDSALSFAIMRGHHLDIAVLGAFEVSATGDLANWWTGEPNDPQGIGGAMDLAVGAKAVWVLTEHTTRDGAPKIVETCRYPLTARNIVNRIFTELATIEVTSTGLQVSDMVNTISKEQLQSLTGVALSFKM